MIKYILNNGLSFIAVVVSVIALYLNHKTNNKNEQLAEKNTLLETSGRFCLYIYTITDNNPLLFSAIYGNETTIFHLQKIVIEEKTYSMNKVFKKHRRQGTGPPNLTDINGKYVEGKVGDSVAYSGIIDGVNVTFNTIVLGNEHEPLF